MNCAHCGENNPSEAKFCMNCGGSLEIACPQCDTALPPDARFCMSCGHQLEAGSTTGMRGQTTQSATTELATRIAEATGTGERRVITMLFADVMGSSAAAERLGPERWAAIMRDAFDRFIAPVERYEGSVARMLGDAILAYFGAPVAHEDDPQRAILAALEIVEATKVLSAELEREHGVAFDCRIGINTGLVIVGEVGSEMYGEYAALGDAANVAARMEQTAVPGSIQVAEATHRLVAPLFEFEPVGHLDVKGREEPIGAWRVIGTKAQPGRLRGIEGLESPVVGRSGELATLQNALTDLAAGQGQIVSLIAEAGLGKSRLAAEIALASEQLEPPVRWIEGASFSYDTRTPFAPVASIMAACLGVAQVADGERYARIKSIVSQHPGAELADAPLLAALLGIDADPQDAEAIGHLMPPQTRQMTIEAVARHIEAVAGSGPMIVAFEDLHWADPATIEVVGRLLAATDRMPLMVLSLFRPRRDEAAWEIHELAQRSYPHRYTSVLLRPLGETQTRELVANLLRVDGLDTQLRESILDKSEGNPFFVEEVIRSLLDDGTIVPEGDRFVATRQLTSIAVPNSLAAVISTRLDQLGPEMRRLIQAASVVGREFDEDIVSAFGDPTVDVAAALSDLQRRELIIQLPSESGRRYTFKHALTMDTAYDTLLESTRVDLHRIVGKLLEERHPDRVVQLANHFVKGNEPLRAVPYLVAAGDKMSFAFMMPDAIEFYEKAIELAAPETETAVVRQAYEGLANAHMFQADLSTTVQTYEQMRADARAREDTSMEVSSLNKEAFARYFIVGETDIGGKLVNDALQLAEATGDLSGQAECHATYCGVKLLEGEIDAAQAHLSDMREVGVAIDSLHHRLFAMAHTGMTMSLSTRYAEAEVALAEAMAEAKRHGARQFEAEIMAMIDPYRLAGLGQMQAAYDRALEGVTLAIEISDVAHLAWGRFSAGLVARMLGRYDVALAHLAEAREVSGALGNSGLVHAAAAIEAVIRFELEGPDSPEGAELSELADAQLRIGGMGGTLATLTMGEQADAALRQGDIARAESFISLGLQSLGSTRIVGRPNLLLCQGAIALLRGDEAGLGAAVATAEDFLDEHPVAWSMPRLHALKGAAAILASDHEGAADHVDRALSSAREMGLLPDLIGLHETLALASTQAGRADDAAHHQAAARSVRNEIAGQLQDETMQSVYRATAIDS